MSLLPCVGFGVVTGGPVAGVDDGGWATVVDGAGALDVGAPVVVVSGGVVGGGVVGGADVVVVVVGVVVAPVVTVVDAVVDAVDGPGAVTGGGWPPGVPVPSPSDVVLAVSGPSVVTVPAAVVVGVNWMVTALGGRSGALGGGGRSESVSGRWAGGTQDTPMNDRTNMTKYSDAPSPTSRPSQ